MQATPPYDDILEDETLAPLKRNHACLQCKKRKVKCDAVRPTCNPCMRSHAHALRAAQRSKTRPPTLVCTYAEEEDDAGHAGVAETEAERKRVNSAVSSAKRVAVGNGGVDRKISREKELRVIEERETLKARIAELEARIAGLTTGSSSDNSNSNTNSNTTSRSNSDFVHPCTTSTRTFSHPTFPTPPVPINSLPAYQPAVLTIESGPAGTFQSFDFSDLLVMPANWPRNLPSPPILEHLIETFFQYEPQTPRMIHRPTLLTRIKLAPTHRDFPFPGLLHAICAAAAPHTAWTVSISPDKLEDSRYRHVAMGLDLETAEDFATAQCEAAERCIRHGTMTQMIGTGQYVFDLVRAHILLSYSYLAGGMALRAWITGGIPGRLIKALEINNKNPRNGVKPAIMAEPTCDAEREERLAAIWLSFLSESGFSVNSCWGQSFQLHDIAIPLPTSTDQFIHKYDSSGFMRANPQHAHDADVMTNHPMPDPFVLAVKSSFLLGNAGRFTHEWTQRDIVPGDDKVGLTWPSYIKLTRDIAAFQASLPVSLRAVYRLVDAGDLSGFNADLLSVHIYPNVALAVINEPFVDWDSPADSEQLRTIQKAFEAVTGVLHLVPTQLDVSLIFSPLLTFSLFTIGRFVVRFIVRARKLEQFSSAMRWRTDYLCIINLFQRYGAKHLIGTHLVQYLANHELLYESGQLPDEIIEACNPQYARLLEPPGPPARSSSASDIEFVPSLGSSAPSASTSGTSPNAASLGQTPESMDVEAGLANGSVGQRQSPSTAGTTYDPMDYINPMDPNAIDQMAAFISTSAQGQAQDKNGLSEQFVNEMLMASALGQNGLNWG